MLKVSARRDVIHFAKHPAAIFAQNRRNLLRLPNVELSFLSFAAGIFSAVKSAGLVRHPAEDVIASLARDAAEEGIRSGLIRFEISIGQQRVVVEHLFEMWHEPALVNAVARKPAGEMIVDAAAGHL